MEKEKVSNWMNTKISVVHVNDNIDHAIKLMEQNKFTHLMVEDDNAICGIISKSDIVARLKSVAYTTSGKTYNEKFLKGLKVWECMSNSPDCVNEEDNLEAAAKMMIEKNHHALPVLNADGKITGLISTLDIVKSVYMTK